MRGSGLSCETTGVLGLVPHAGDVGAKRRAADLVERAGERLLRTGGDDRLEAGEHALPVGLPERNEPQAGRYEIARHRLQKGGERRLERDAMTGARDRDRDRIGEGTVPRRSEPIERRASPGRARRLEERAALRGGLQKALPARREGGGKLGDRGQRRIVACSNRAMRVNQKHRVAKSAAVADHHREPVRRGLPHP